MERKNMSKKKVASIRAENTVESDRIGSKTRAVSWLKAYWWTVLLFALLSMGAFGAVWKYIEEAGPKTNFTTSKEPHSSSSGMNPAQPPPPSSTTLQPAKDYIYTGSRLTAVEEPGVSMSPPSDLAVWRPSSGVWYVMAGNGDIQAAAQWGLGTDTPTPGDFDGDGKTDFAVYRPGTPSFWYVLGSSDNSFSGYQFGISTDVPAPADFDGDGQTDLAVWRVGDGMWHVYPSATQQYYALAFGTNGDKPVPADYDGDGKADIAVWRASDTFWYIWKSSDWGYRFEQFGNAQDKPVIGDYDGDGKFDLAVWQSGGTWRINQSSNGLRVVNWGIFPSDIPVQGDYDADGKTDVAIWRPSDGYWWIEQSATNYSVRAAQWGMNGDIPVPAPYRR